MARADSNSHCNARGPCGGASWLTDLLRSGDFRKKGTEHGKKCAKAILEAIKAGARDPQALWKYYTQHDLPAKEAELRALGSADAEIAAFLKASIKVTRDLLDKIGRRARQETRRLRP